MVALLAKKGADINAKDKDGLSPLRLALAAGHGPVAQLLASTGARQDVLTLAGLGRTGALAKVIQDGADTDAADGTGRTVVHYAAVNGRKEAVRLVLDQGARVDFADAHGGRTPLHYAAEHGHADVAELLLARGAAVNVIDSKGPSPVCMALDSLDEDVAKPLLESGADPRIGTTERGNTALYEAAALGYDDLVQRMLAKGAELDAGKNGWTRWHGVVPGGKEVLKALIACGADADATDKEGNTPLHETALQKRDLCSTMDGWPWRIGRTEVAKALLGKGADVDAGNLEGSTPLHRAKLTAAATDIASLEVALDLFVVDTGRYPTSAEGLAALLRQPDGLEGWRGPYARRLADGPWGRPYRYRCPGEHNKDGFDLWA